MPSRNNTPEETLHVWKMWGKYYGYPDCCVEAFLKGEQHFGGYFSGTGFVPCEKCHFRPVEDVVQQILTNRISCEEFLDWSSRSYSEEELDFCKRFWNSFTNNS